MGQQLLTTMYTTFCFEIRLRNPVLEKSNEFRHYVVNKPLEPKMLHNSIKVLYLKTDQNDLF